MGEAEFTDGDVGGLIGEAQGRYYGGEEEGEGGMGPGALVAGGVAISVALLLLAFIVFDFVRDLGKSDSEREKDVEQSRRGVVQAKSFRGWAMLGLVICVVVVANIHHISTKPALTPEQAHHMIKGPIEDNPTVRALTQGGMHTEAEARQKIHDHIKNNPKLLQPRPIAEAKEEHLLVGGLAAAIAVFLVAYLVIDFLREMNRTTYKPQTEQDRRAALRCWALLGIIICCVVVKHLHHAKDHLQDEETEDMHAKHFNPDMVEGGALDSTPEGPHEWVEEHGILRVKQVKDEVTGDQRTCAYEGERCHCDGHVRYGDGDSFTDWQDAVESIMCTNDAFGEDPAPHKVKICQCRPEIRECATEGGLCTCEGGRVRYGYGDKWTDWVNLEEESSHEDKNKILCANSEFGDPHAGKIKVCQCEESLPEAGIESPDGLEPGDDRIDPGYLEQGRIKIEEDERTAGRASSREESRGAKMPNRMPNKVARESNNLMPKKINPDVADNRLPKKVDSKLRSNQMPKKRAPSSNIS